MSTDKCAICVFIEVAATEPRTAVMCAIVTAWAVARTPDGDIARCERCDADLRRAIEAHNRLTP